MGQTLSSHDLFISGLKESLKTRGIKARKKDLRSFFDFLSKVCPWFPQEGTINFRCWQRVGDCLQDFYSSFGPQKVPVSAFNYWSLINDILKVHSHDPDVKQVIQTGETALREASRPPSACGSVTINMPPNDTVDEKSHPETNTETPAPRLYPCLRESGDTILPPEDQATLDKEAARYNPENLPTFPATNIHQPPPYGSAQLPPFVAPVAVPPLPLIPVNSTPVTSVSLSQQISILREALKEKRQHLGLLKELRALEAELASLSLSTPVPPGPSHKHIKAKTNPKSPKTILAFPITRSQVVNTPPDSQTHEDEEEDDSAEIPTAPPKPQENSDEDSEEEPENNEPPGRRRRPQQYRPLKIKYLKDLKSAVHTYGPTAPFTLALLESLSDRWLMPNDWYTLAHASLSGGDFVRWRSEYAENCRKIAERNAQSANSRSWTRDRLLGRSPYDTIETQTAFPPGLLAQIENAALKAWRRLPPKGPVSTSLAKIHQGPDESYCDFISRLTDAAERLLGREETESTFIKHLAFENANPACQEALRAHRDTSLSNYIKLCSGIGASHALGLAIGAALRDFTHSGATNTQKIPGPQGSCFRCGQKGHFAKECPNNQQPRQLPSTVCPRCKRGKHWVRDCHSKTDASGNPLPSRSGNPLRGQPLAPHSRNGPGAIRFVPQTPCQDSPFPPSVEPPQAVPDWTSCPPPQQY